jgi:uncharacterized protein YutE (UPF0331/DUF86 family)
VNFRQTAVTISRDIPLQTMRTLIVNACFVGTVLAGFASSGFAQTRCQARCPDGSMSESFDCDSNYVPACMRQAQGPRNREDSHDNAAADRARAEAAAAAEAQRQRDAEATEQNNMGLDAWKKRDWATAADHFQKALQNNPDNQTFEDNLDRANKKLEEQHNNEVGLRNMEQIMQDLNQSRRNSTIPSSPLGIDDNKINATTIDRNNRGAGGLGIDDDRPSQSNDPSTFPAKILATYQPEIKEVEAEIHRAQDALRQLIRLNTQSEEQRLEWTKESEKATIDAQRLSVNLVIDLVGAQVDHLAKVAGQERAVALNHLLNRAERDGSGNSIHAAYGMLINRKDELERMHNDVRLIGKENDLRKKIEDFSVNKDAKFTMENLWDVVSQLKKVEELAGPSKDLLDAACTIYSQATSLDNLAMIQANQEKTLQAAAVLRDYIVRLEAQKKAGSFGVPR